MTTNLRTSTIVMCLILTQYAPAQAETSVVASIKPVHSLVAGVMAGVGSPHLIVNGPSSPHSYAMRPSDASALERASLVFWIGENLETFFKGPLNGLARNAVVVTLLDAPGIKTLPQRSGADRNAHDESHENQDISETRGDDEGVHSGKRNLPHNIDLHVWLDPLNAKAMVSAIVKALSQADPTNAVQYAANGNGLVARLDKLARDIAQDLEPVKQRAFVNFHDSFRYFNERFGLNALGAVTLHPEILPGAERLAKIRKHIRKYAVSCVFAEPQFSPKLVKVVVEGTAAKTSTLDPLGADLPKGSELYFELMSRNAKALKECLT